MPGPRRLLLVTADDFGIGPATSRGILDLADRGAITSTVLLVNSPHAADAVAQWRQRGSRLELGWHPCLTLDRPVLPAEQVPTLVDEAGQFLPLGRFLQRLLRGGVRDAEVRAELAAQLERFLLLVGGPPANVNAHHHLHVFPLVGRALRAVLTDLNPSPYLRRVVEPMRTLRRVPGARVKRLALRLFGEMAARRQAAAGFPGNESLIGITDPPFVHDPAFFTRWLAAVPGRVVELTCHPSFLDATLHGRDGTLADGQLHRRYREWQLLGDASFEAAVQQAGFTLVSAAELMPAPICRNLVRLPSPLRSGRL